MEEKKRKKRFIIIVIFLLGIFAVITLRNSYALFEENIEGNKINFVVGKLNYSFILDEDVQNGIYLKPNEYKVVHIELTNTNDIDTKYAFVYKNENINDLSIGYLPDYGSSASDETIESGEKKQIYIGIHNKNDKDINLEIDVRGSLPKNNVEVENGYTKITEDATETYKDSILNGADPLLGEGMIPITLDDDGTVKSLGKCCTSCK